MGKFVSEIVHYDVTVRLVQTGRYGGSNIDKICVINTMTYIFLESPCPEVLPLIFIFKKIS